MPTNKPARPQPALTRHEIEEIATQAAYREVQRLLGDDAPVQEHAFPQIRDDIARIAVPEPLPTPHLTIVNMPPVRATERRFVAHLPAKENGLPEQVHGTRNMETGQVVLDDAQGMYRSWVEFLNACHVSGQTPTKIEDE